MRSVRYYIQPSPLGELVVAATSEGLCLIHWDDPAKAIEILTRSFSDVLHVAPIAVIRSQIDEYLAGRRRSFELPLDLSLASSFVGKVLVELNKVPFGQWTTYGALARAVYSHPRAVGGAVGRNPIPIVVLATGFSRLEVRSEVFRGGSSVSTSFSVSKAIRYNPSRTTGFV